MAKYGFIIDVDRCNGCYSCFLACKDEYTGNCHLPYGPATAEGENLIRVTETEYGTENKVKTDYVAAMCQHCEDPACAVKFPELITKRDDGVVLINSEKAKGCKELLKACPYGAIIWNEAAQMPQKCDMCAHMLDAGEKTTRCAECCPNQALLFGDFDDPDSQVSRFAAEHKDELEKLRPEYNCKPGTWYMYLPKPFICGEVICAKCGEDVKGASVRAVCGECGSVFETVTDFLGDFEIKFLPKNKPFTVTVEAEGFRPKTLKCRTMASVNLGEIFLEKA